MFKKWHINKNMKQEDKDKILRIDNRRRAQNKSSVYGFWNANVTLRDIEGWRAETIVKLEAGDTRALQNARRIRNATTSTASPLR